MADSDDDGQATLELLSSLWEDPWAWKHRLVYRVSLSTVTHARVESHYQVVLPPALTLAAGMSDQAEGRVLLPLSWRPKELLLNVQATSSADKPVHLLTRNEIAELHADQLVERMAASAPVDAPTWDRRAASLEAVARTMPRRARTLTSAGGGLRSPVAIAAYVEEAVGFDVPPEVVEGWMTRLRTGEQQLWAAHPLGDPDDNVACNFVLALPELRDNSSLRELETAVSDYVDLMETAIRLGDPSLRDLVRIGVEWPLIVDTTLGPGTPTTLTFTEDRPLPPTDLRTEALEVPVPTGDAASLHVETQLLDSSVLLENVKMVDVDGHEFPLAEDVRATMDRHAVYLSAPTRPSRGRLQVTVRLAGEVATSNRVVTWLTVAALVVALLGTNDAQLFSMLVIPVTLAVSVIQVRERTSLVRALTGSTRSWLVGTALALWGVVVARMLVQSPDGQGLIGLLS